MAHSSGREKFVRTEFPWPKTGIEWIGDVGYARSPWLPIVVSISISGDCTEDGGCGTLGDYNGFKVRVVHKETGELDHRYFRFDHFLDIANPSESPPVGCRPHLQVVSHCGWSWHVNKPKSTKPIVEAIQQYINLWWPPAEPAWKVK